MHSRLFPFIILFISIYIAGCQKVDIQYGSQYVDNQYTQIVKVDTFSTSLSTIYVDSFPTSGTGVTLLGGYSDSSFGRIDTKCFFDLQPPSYAATNALAYDSTIYDSLRLILRLTRNYYGDTTNALHLDVRKLSQQIILPQYATNFYNNQQFNTFSTPIGSGDFIVNPTFYTDTISIKLSDAFGMELLSKLRNPSDVDMQSNSNFLYYLNGLQISSNSNANLILNCKDSVVMRLSYSKVGVDTLENHHVDFILGNKQHHFNNITVDRSKLKNGLNNIGHNDSIISSKLLNNRAYSQYASGVVTKISFPSLSELLKVPYYIKILSARLKIVPVRGTYDTYYFLPPTLTLANTNLTNTIGPILTSPTTGQAETGNLYLDPTYNDNTAYSYDVSSYIKQLIANPLANNYGLLLLPSYSLATTEFSRIVVGDNSVNTKTNATKLEIYYLTVQPQ